MMIVGLESFQETLTTMVILTGRSSFRPDLKICSGKCFLEPKHEVAHMYMLTDAMDEMVFKSPLLC